MLFYHTVNDMLKNSLITLMNAPIFQNFRLVGMPLPSLVIMNINKKLYWDKIQSYSTSEKLVFFQSLVLCLN